MALGPCTKRPDQVLYSFWSPNVTPLEQPSPHSFLMDSEELLYLLDCESRGKKRISNPLKHSMKFLNNLAPICQSVMAIN